MEESKKQRHQTLHCRSISKEELAAAELARALLEAGRSSSSGCSGVLQDFPEGGRRWKKHQSAQTTGHALNGIFPPAKQIFTVDEPVGFEAVRWARSFEEEELRRKRESRRKTPTSTTRKPASKERDGPAEVLDDFEEAVGPLPLLVNPARSQAHSRPEKAAEFSPQQRLGTPKWRTGSNFQLVSPSPRQAKKLAAAAVKLYFLSVRLDKGFVSPN